MSFPGEGHGLQARASGIKKYFSESRKTHCRRQKKKETRQPKPNSIKNKNTPNLSSKGGNVGASLVGALFVLAQEYE
jgi:hypothetical protein